MKAQELIDILSKNPNFPVKLSTSIFDENGIDITDVILQEYDDGKLEYELVLIGNNDE